MAKDSEIKEFVLPEALPFGYPFTFFVEYVVDRVPEFQSVSGSRKGAKLIDAVVTAEKSDDHIVTWPTDLWKTVVNTLKSDAFQMPKNYFIRNGAQTDQLVPLRLYLPHADAILEATDPKPKSDTVEESVTEAPKESSGDSAAA